MEKAKKKEAKQTAKAIEKIEHIHTILEKTAGTMGDEKATIYDPVLPFHRQAARLVGSGGNVNLLGIPYTFETVYFKPVMINGNEYYVSLNKKTEIGSDNGVYLYNKLSFEVIDVAAKKMFSDIDPKDIDSMLHSLYDQSKELSYHCK